MDGNRRGRKKPRNQAGAAGAAGAARSATQDGKDEPGRKKQRRTFESPVPDSVSRCQVTIAHLPGLVLTLIFGHLDEQDKASAAVVCSGWRNLVYTPSLWKNVTVCLHLDALSSADIHSLKKRGIRNVRVLSCSRREKVKELINTVDTIEVFEVECYTMTESRIRDVFTETLPKMRSLVLKMSNVSTLVCSYLADLMANLESLQLVGPWSGDTLSAVSTVRQVKSLFFVDTRVRPVSIPTLPSEPVEMPCMTFLVLWGAKIGDSVLCYLKRAAPNLQRLHVELCGSVTEEGVKHLAQLHKLHALSIASKLALPSMASIVNLVELRVLDLLLASISSDDVKFLGQLPALKHLSLLACRLGAEGWRQFSQGFRNLQGLSLCKLNRLSKKEAEYLGQLPHLEELQTYFSSEVFDFQCMCKILKNLKALTVSCPKRFKDKDLQVIAQMPNLKSLVLRTVLSITDEGLRCLSEGRAPLEILGLHQTNLTSRGLMHLADRPRTLRELHMSGKQDCVEGLPELLQRNQSLRTVRANMSGRLKQELKQIRPGLILKPNVAESAWSTILMDQVQQRR